MSVSVSSASVIGSSFSSLSFLPSLCWCLFAPHLEVDPAFLFFLFCLLYVPVCELRIWNLLKLFFFSCFVFYVCVCVLRIWKWIQCFFKICVFLFVFFVSWSVCDKAEGLRLADVCV
jgi:hypothetical protein